MINVEIGGKTVEGVAQANKDGFVYFVNAATGQPVFPIEEKPVPQSAAVMATYPTQPIPTMPPFDPLKGDAQELAHLQTEVKAGAEQLGVQTPTVLANSGYAGDDVFSPWGEIGETTIQVSSGGESGSRVGNNAYDPETGDYYVCSMLNLWAGSFDTQNQIKQGETFGIGKTAIFKLDPVNDSRGYVTAYNMQTGHIIWSDEWPHECYGGVTVTKGGLVFAGTDEGEIQAFNAATGATVWSFAIGAGPSMISVYEFAGKERVSIYAGGSDLGDTKHGDYLWQFSLNGTGPSPKVCSQCIPAGEFSEPNPVPIR